MTLKSVKKIAARVLNCGQTRIKIVDEEKAREALTADNVRELIKTGGIKQKPVKGTGRAKAREKKEKERRFISIVL